MLHKQLDAKSQLKLTKHENCLFDKGNDPIGADEMTIIILFI